MFYVAPYKTINGECKPDIPVKIDFNGYFDGCKYLIKTDVQINALHELNEQELHQACSEMGLSDADVAKW